MESANASARPRLSFAARLARVLVWIGIVGGILAVVLWVSPTAREVAGESSFTLLQVLTTPFIFELSLAILGVCVVITLNNLRMKKEGDEWVYLEVPQSQAGKNDDDTPPHRLDGVIWKEKPEAFDQAGADLSVIEGYVSLGMSADALRELQGLPDQERELPAARMLQARALVMEGRQEEAGIVFDAVSRSPGAAGGDFASAALMIAEWCDQAGKPAGEIEPWVKRALALDPRCLDELTAGHPARRWRTA